ncbi:MAG: sigma-70 family RNA polymerase sigma factor [Bacteroidales bacterium]|nr:sigma-70 family RNA polymerase sigma factor [Bacteroidales bacterium]
MNSELEIIKKCRSGDKKAFRELVVAYQRLVFSIALKMLTNEDDAKDIVQETFIRVWNNLDSYNENKKFSTWIITIASRLCLDNLDKQKRLLPMADDEKIFNSYVSDYNFDKQLENRDWIAIVKMLANDLSPKQKLVFTLSQLECFDNEEIVEITGLTAEKIKSNLYVAKQTIRERLIKLGYGK